MKDRTRTVVVGVLEGGLGSLGVSGCDTIKAAFDVVDPEPECCYNPPPPTPDPNPPPEPQQFTVVDEGELPSTALPGDPPHHRASDWAWDGARALNATHPERGSIYRTTGSCYVHLDWPEDARPVPGMVPPTATVSCPEPMAEFLWSQCYTGTIYTDAAGETCVCAVSGNPPPPAQYVHYPAEAKPQPE